MGIISDFRCKYSNFLRNTIKIITIIYSINDSNIQLAFGKKP